MQARASLLGRHEVIDGLALLQPLLHLDEQLHAVHHHLHQLHLREAQAVCVGDVKDPAHGSRVHTAWRDSQVSRPGWGGGVGCSGREGCPQALHPTHLCLASEAAAA